MRGISIYTQDAEVEKVWISEIRSIQRTLFPAVGEVVASVRDELFNMIWIDSNCKTWKKWAQDLDRKDKTLVLVVDENSDLPTVDDLRCVDEILVAPFRMMDVLTLFRRHHLRTADSNKSESENLNQEMQEARTVIHEANQMMERILAARSPKRFNGIKGISITNRHLSGLKPGGDYFDVFESKNHDFVHFLLADSSSYGLSSALLGMILSSSAKLASDVHMNSAQWVHAIAAELKTVLGEHDHLNLFFGRLNRRDFTLHYQLYGSIEAYVLAADGSKFRFEKTGGSIQSKFMPVATEHHFTLNPKDRMILISDGFVNGSGGEQALQKLFTDHLTRDPFHLVNELSYQVKSKLNAEDVFPGEDCSAVVIDIEARVLRLAPVG
jgi:hypothetical protein